MLLHSRPVHDKRQMAEAARAGADFVFLSPLFPTRSHPGSLVLGRTGFAALARLAPMPVIALGGVRAAHRHMLAGMGRSEEHTSELQSLMRISYAVFCLKKKKHKKNVNKTYVKRTNV